MNILIPLFTALVAAGAFIKIPLGAVPITLQTLFCFLMALLLNPKSSLISISLYLFIGAIGLPIFTTGGGLAALLGPTGGFLLAMLPATVLGSTLASKRRDSILYNVCVLLLMEVVIYVIGVPFLMFKLNLSFKAAMIAGCVPFLPGDALKIVIASISAKYLYPECKKLENRKKDKDTE